jgi:hypothetical protein
MTEHEEKVDAEGVESNSIPTKLIEQVFQTKVENGFAFLNQNIEIMAFSLFEKHELNIINITKRGSIEA